MKRLMLTVAALAVATGLTTAAAVAANYAPPPPGTPVYGPLVATPPAGAVPPADAPPGYHYEWIYGYDHHGYRAHWEAVRNS